MDARAPSVLENAIVTARAAAVTRDGSSTVSIDFATHINSGASELGGVRFPPRIGGLDPFDTDDGVAQRLRNHLLTDDELTRGS